MEFYNNVASRSSSTNWSTTRYAGFAVVYRQVYDVIRIKQLFYEGDHVFVTREEAQKILHILVMQYLEGELFE